MATRGIAVYKNELYIGTQNINFSRIHFTNPLLFKTVSAGAILAYNLFEYVRNNHLALLFYNLLIPLAGIASDGCEVWRYNDSLDKWSLVVSDQPGSMLPAGFGDKRNFAAAVIHEFKGDLYVGTAAGLMLGCQLWRYNGTTWEKVVLPGGDGFGSKWNIYAWSMGCYNNSLYVGTLNFKPDKGCQLWRYNGWQWFKISLPGGDGFGERYNMGARSMVEYPENSGGIVVGTFSLDVMSFRCFNGCEVWMNMPFNYN
ncbi:MAG: hypothetical protein J7L32_03010 [Thermoplasmata archaeon]|nr:hypothetical protein [Thermoplasmata archaeon]